MPALLHRHTAFRLILTLAICALATIAAAAAGPVARCDDLEVKQVQFGPIAPAKSTVAITVRNLTHQPQVFGVHIQTRTGPSGGGWGTQFTDQLAPAVEKTLLFGYAFVSTPEPAGWVRLRFYNPPVGGEIEFERFFHEVKRTVADIGLAPKEPGATSPATAQVSKAVRAQFARFQQALREKKYEQAWPLLSRTCRQAAFFNRLEGPFSFTSAMNMDPSPATWGREDVLRLEPAAVRMGGPVAVLSARHDDATWTVEFTQENGEWRVDWINGRPPLPLDRGERLARLLPRLEHRATAHFDIYYARGSSAARDIDRIAEERERGYQAVSEALGVATGPRILLVFFEDADTKAMWARHQGNGLAEGTMIVEIYNDSVKVDPFHEATHIIAAAVGSPPAIFDEGLATYMAARLGGHEGSLYEEARQLKQEGKWIPLTALLTFTEIGSEESQPAVAYPEAGAFVKFVMDRYGKEKFLAAYRELRKSDDKGEQQGNVAALERITGQSLNDMNHAWLAAMEIEEKAETRRERGTMKPFVAPAEPMSASYTIDVRLDPTEKRVTGTETIRLVNRSTLTLQTLAIARGIAEAESLEVSIGGAKASPEEGDDALLVPLPEPLAPGGTVELRVAFRAPLEPSEYGDYRLLDWHPKLWWGYSTWDNYEVRIEAPAGLNLAVSGRRGDDGTWRAKAVRSFGIVTASDYQMTEAEAGEVHLRALYKPAGKECAEEVLRTAVEVVNFYGKEFGLYPQPFLSIVPGMDRPAGGYPVATGIVAIHGEEQFAKKPADHWHWITAHEIGHQYWGEYVLSDELGSSWLPIGLGIFMDREYARTHGISPEVHRQLINRYVRGLREGNDTTIERPAEQIARVTFDHNNVVVHGKGFAVISALDEVLGRDAFRRIHNRCLREYAGKRLNPSEFQKVCEAETGQDLGWFFDQWVRSNRYLGYRIASTKSTGNGGRSVTRATVERVGTLDMPVPVEARFADGSTQRARTERLREVQDITFESASPVKEVVLDPEGSLPLLQSPITDVEKAVAELPWSGAAQKARDLLPLVREKAADDPRLWLKLGLNLYDGALYPEAMEAFTRVSELPGDSDMQVVGLVWQGHILDLTGRRKEALARYREAKKRGLSGQMRHDQWGIVIDNAWIEARLKTPFARPK